MKLSVIKKGFSLIEVVVALFILSISVITIYNLIISTSVSSYDLEQRYLAKEVANNHIALLNTIEKPLRSGNRKGEMIMGGQNWVWDEEIYDTSNEDYFEYEDLILGNIKIPSENIEDFSIARSDKSPTFILSNLVDDHLDQITHVIRGNDHSINTIKQKLIAESLSFNKIKYAHIPLIHDLNGKKLSKRDNITNVDFYLNEGFLKESIFNFIIKLGNNFNDLEYLNIQDAINNFEISKIVLSPAKFDTQKLEFINQHYLNQLSFQEFKLHINSKNLKDTENYNLDIIYKDILSRITSTKKINEEISCLINFFHKKQTVDIDNNEKDLIQKIYKTIQDLHNEEDLLDTLEKNDLFLKKIGKTVRKIFVNFESKLPIDKIIFFYGISNFKERLLLYLP